MVFDKHLRVNLPSTVIPRLGGGERTGFSMPPPSFNQIVEFFRAFGSIKLHFVRLDPSIQSADLSGSLTLPQYTAACFLVPVGSVVQSTGFTMREKWV